MLETTFFNDWYYGTMNSSLHDGINVGVFDPAGFEALTECPPKDTLIVGFYIVCPDKIRLMRSLARENDPDIKEIIRRYTTDEEDFLDFEQNPYIKQGNILSNASREDLSLNLVYITNNVNDIWTERNNLPQ